MKLFALSLIAAAAFGQMRDNRDKSMKCDDGNHGKQARICKIDEQTISSIGRLAVDAGRNGGVQVKGWSQQQTLVRVKIEAWADTEAEANSIAGQVHSDNLGGQIRPSGPQNQNRTGWAVSYEVFVPYSTDLNLVAINGGIQISDVRGRLEFKTQNGGVHLARIGGDVSGQTQNGGVHVALEGNRWDGNQLEVKTQNGGVHLSVPDNYSARIKSETVNGGIHSDFPLRATGETRPRDIDLTVGSGGALIHVSTVNGGVQLKKI